MENSIGSTIQLAQILKGYRKKAELTQIQAGLKAGLQQKTVSSIENNPGPSKIENLFKLLYALNLEITIKERSLNDNNEEW